MKRGGAGILVLAFALVGICGAFPGGNAEPAVRSIVETGHAGAVQGLEYDEKRGLLFSSGDDGTVRVWNASAGTLVHTLQVSQLGTGLLAVNPAQPQVAVVVTDGTSTFFLSVWDWEQERQVFRVSLRQEPLFVRYSGAGNFLLFGESSMQGLSILHASDGSRVPFHPEGFGIVGFAEMSRSERTILTYQVSGRLSYWDFATGQQSLDVPTVPYLSDVRISRDRRYIVGSTTREVVLVDTVTGATRGRADIPLAVSCDISPGGDAVAGIAAADGRLSQWGIAGDTLALRPSRGSLAAPPSLVRYGDSGLFVGDASGNLLSVSPDGTTRQFSTNVIASLTGFDAARGLLAVGSADWVRIFASDLLTGARSPTFLRSMVARNPFGAAAGLVFASDTLLLAWQSDGGGPAFSQLDTSGIASGGSPTGAFRGWPTGFRAPVSSLRVSGNSLLGVEKGSTVRVVDLGSGAPRFDLTIPSAAAVVAAASGDLVAGRNASSASEGSLVRVNTRTGETVAIKDRNLFTYGMLLDSAPATGPVLYTVGVDGAGATNLLMHDGPGFEHETLLDTAPGEDLDVSITQDPGTRILYASLGRDRVVSWDGSTMRTVPLENAVSLALLARDGLLYSLNRDSTVTVADSASGKRLAEISLFTDGEWCVLFRDGSYMASPGGDVHVRVFVNGEPYKATEDYRLRIQQ